MSDTVQNVLGGSSSIVAVDPPPEGKAGCLVKFTIDPVIGFVAQSFQMSNAQGLSISQVISLVIDNSLNPCAITVTHGVLSEKTVVAGFGLQIVPTFSNKGAFPITIMQTPGANSVPSLAIVNVSFLNYNRPAASIGGSNGAAANAPQTTAGNPVTTGVSTFTAVNQVLDTFIGIQNQDNTYASGAYFIYNLDLTIGSCSAIGAGAVIVDLEVSGLDSAGNDTWQLNWFAVAVATGAGAVALNQWRNWQFNPTPISGQFNAAPAGDPDPQAFIKIKPLQMTNASVVNYCLNIVRNVVAS